MSSRKLRIVVTGGGTGGHVFPALSMAEELRAHGHEITYVGSATGMEAKLVPPKGFVFVTTKVGAVKNQSPLTILKTLWRLLGSVLWAVKFLRQQEIDAVLGVGGYVSVPISVAAFLTRTPLYLQEQNVSVGLANRFLGKVARRIFLGFGQAAEWFPAHKCLDTGNPIRPDFYESIFPRYNPESKCLLIFGGSQGSQAVNDAVLSCYEKFRGLCPDWQIVHQTGERDFARVQAKYLALNASRVEVLPFLNDMPKRYANASLIISRSGALTVAELIQVGRPAILIPFPRKGQNDQTSNAYYLEKAGMALTVEQGERFKERLWEALEKALASSRLPEMARQSTKLQRPNALGTIRASVEADF